MGTVYELNRIRICLYTIEHNPPHVHALYSEYEALIEISSGEVIRGYLPKPQLKKVKEWISDEQVKESLIEKFYYMNPTLRRG
jgi:hypothetical protein